jgi:DNA-directed RNA polymerase subunit omega
LKENTFDSKFRFIIVAAQRAKQLLKGSQPKIKSKHKNPMRVAQEEIKSGAVQYEILPFKKEEGLEEEEVLLTEAIPFAAAETEADFEGQEAEELEEEELEEAEELEEGDEGGFSGQDEDK